jgi:hypothetical protein
MWCAGSVHGHLACTARLQELHKHDTCLQEYITA